MKIEQLIVQYLYTNKKVTLQDIGVFYLSPNVTIPHEQDKDLVLPANAISFEYNTKAVQDDNLIDFIVQQTRKIKPLATSDLESFTILGRQFMNIGKPLPIEGLGTLQKNQQGEYEFIQGNTINPRLEPVPALLREKNKEDIIFTTPARRPQGKAGIIAAIVIFLILGASAVFYFVFKSNKDQKNEQLLVQKPDTTINKKDTTHHITSLPAIDTAKLAAIAATDTVSFNILIRNYKTREKADAVFKKYTGLGHKLVQYSTDSSGYKIAMPFVRPLYDTTVLKDSLKSIFTGSNPSVEMNQQ